VMFMDEEAMTPFEVDQFNYAVGVLALLGHKYGAHDVTIYHGNLRIRIERLNDDTDDDQRDRGTR